jgi:hypothetical protein
MFALRQCNVASNCNDYLLMSLLFKIEYNYGVMPHLTVSIKAWIDEIEIPHCTTFVATLKLV